MNLRVLTLVMAALVLVPPVQAQTSMPPENFVIEEDLRKSGRLDGHELITEVVYVNNEMIEFDDTPPPLDLYETVYETVIFRAAYKDYHVTEASFEWIEGEHPGQSTVIEYVPAQFEKVVEPVTLEEASTKLINVPPTCRREDDGSITVTSPSETSEIMIPAVTKDVVYWKVKLPPSIKETQVANIIKNGKTRIMSSPSEVIELNRPAMTRQVPRRVVRSTWCSGERVIPAGWREITCRLSKF